MISLKKTTKTRQEKELYLEVLDGALYVVIRDTFEAKGVHFVTACCEAEMQTFMSR